MTWLMIIEHAVSGTKLCHLYLRKLLDQGTRVTWWIRKSEIDRKEQIQHYFASPMLEKDAQQGSDVVTHFSEHLRLKCRCKAGADLGGGLWGCNPPKTS